MYQTLMQVGGASQAPWWQTPVMMLGVVLIIYFFMIRPQQRKQKELQAQRDALKIGSKIVTSGGILGVIKDVKETEFVVEIADGVRVRVDKNSVYPVVEKK